MINVAILGLGVVGSGTANILLQNKEIIQKRIHDEINIKYILDLRDFPDHPLGDRVVHDINIILNDPEVQIVAELMGGLHPASCVKTPFAKPCRKVCRNAEAPMPPPIARGTNASFTIVCRMLGIILAF